MAQTSAAGMGIAFAMVALAGLCAPLGACVVLVIKKSHMHLLATSLALAAGVMLFVSLTEVLSDSVSEIKSTGWGGPLVWTVTYIAFFGGVALCRVLDWFTDALMHLIATRKDDSSTRDSSCEGIDGGLLPPAPPRSPAPGPADGSHSGSSDSGSSAPSADAVPTVIISHAGAARRHGHSVKAAGGDLELGHVQDGHGHGPHHHLPTTAAAAAAGPAHHGGGCKAAHAAMEVDLLPEEAMDADVLEAAGHLVDDNCSRLGRTCVLVWLALSLHNLPEGLATFVGYMSSPHLGVSVAVAIAIHNIPEGIALGVPIFFATGSRLKAIGWTAVSGLAEPLGALIGLAVQLGGRLNPLAMGIIMALVAGIMVGIALQELLPRAMSFDPTNKFTTYGVFAGMAVMAFSLILLSFMDPTA